MKIGSLEDQKSPKNAKMGILGRQGDTYAVVEYFIETRERFNMCKKHFICHVNTKMENRDILNYCFPTDSWFTWSLHS